MQGVAGKSGIPRVMLIITLSASRIVKAIASQLQGIVRLILSYAHWYHYCLARNQTLYPLPPASTLPMHLPSTSAVLTMVLQEPQVGRVGRLPRGRRVDLDTGAHAHGEPGYWADPYIFNVS